MTLMIPKLQYSHLIIVSPNNNYLAETKDIRKWKQNKQKTEWTRQNQKIVVQ